MELDKQAEKVGLPRAVKNFFKYYATFSGRSSRSEYWYIWLYWSLLFLGVLSFTFVPSVEVQFIGLVAFYIIGIGHLVPFLAIYARRLRDGGFSPYLTFLLLVPFGGLALIVLMMFPSKEPATHSE